MVIFSGVSSRKTSSVALLAIGTLSLTTLNSIARIGQASGNTMSKIVLLVMLGLTVMGTGCSFKRLAVNQVGNALAGGGTTFASDDDPELVKAAVPFSLKLMESLLAESPRHEGLLFATASGFTQYSYAFVQQDADEMEGKDFAAAEEMRARSRRLYLRARNYGLRGLEVKHKGFEKALRSDPKQAVRGATVKDVPLLYWTAASWAGAISLSKDNPDLIGELPMVEAMMDRALALDESFGDGSIHSFFITYEMGRAGGNGDPELRSRKHFDRVMALTGGQQAGPLVSLAEAVCVPKQNVKEFESLLNRALAINPDAKPEWRLANLVAQRRAKWLLTRTDDLFLQKNPTENKESK
ncbi:MAG: hypothetical protein JWQ71_4381 [Pedosphaera sp.]|nr:hypothetical protein [Pedosphaera sp.]